MNYRKSFYLLIAMLIVGWLVMGLGLATEADWLMAVGLVVMLAGIGQGIVFIHCPHCGHSLQVRGGIPSFCPHCGKKLE